MDRAVITRLPMDPPLDPTPGEARNALQGELSHLDYLIRRDWLGDMASWVYNLFRGHPKVPDTPGSILMVGVVVVAVGLVGWWIWRARGSVRGGAVRKSRQGLIEPGVSAADYRGQAVAAIEAGNPDAAVIAAFRSLVADLDARGLMGDQPARTAREAAAAIAGVWTASANDVGQAATVFDLAAYGVSESGHRTTLDQARRVLALADRFAGESAPPVPAVTR